MSVIELCSFAKGAANRFLSASTDVKNRILSSLADIIDANRAEILAANKRDLVRAADNGRNAAFLDRLALNNQRIDLINEGLFAIIALPDPSGEVTESYDLPNGLNVKKVRAPLGVVGIIFEARPNVAVDAAALCIKSGNGVILRGSRDSSESVACLVKFIKQALDENQISQELVTLIEGEDRALTAEMLTQDKYIDVVIPRGGESLKKTVFEHAKMPVIASAGGNCHIYIASSANKDKAEKIVLNAKTNRPSTCNAAETLLFDRKADRELIKSVLATLRDAGVELRGTAEVNEVYPVSVIEDAEFYQEYENLIIKAKFVDGVTEAAEHINKYGTNHSEAIITEDALEGELFQRLVDSAAVYVNASTRFTDGFELGLGAEMGISTQKLHVRGPIGLKELTGIKYVITGDGQVR